MTHKNSRLTLIFLMFALAVLNLSCSEEAEENNTDPRNLQIELTIVEETTVVLQAIALNTVEYSFRLGNQADPHEVNATGTFEHSYDESGNYQIEVRAHGANGRFLREDVYFTIVISDEIVTVDMGYSSPLEYEGYNLVWQDEFEGSAINPDNWVFETGNGCPNLCGWGNNEWQYYRQENAWIDQDENVLTIEARRENVGDSQYTSTRMKTQGKKSFKYGRIDIRALLPKGQGIWPALWMLGDDITSVGWPKCGEIDIMEMIGGSDRENTTHGTLHWDNNGHNYTGGSYTLSSGTFGSEYHVFTILWDENSIQWLVNDVPFHEIDITPSHMTEFHQEFFLLFNVAVGGNWPGYPDQTTVFPQQMKVDYVRVFQPAE